MVKRSILIVSMVVSLFLKGTENQRRIDQICQKKDCKALKSEPLSSTLLFSVISYNFGEGLKLLLKDKADPNTYCISNGRALIHQAVLENKDEIVHILVADEALDINKQDADGLTPLHCSIMKNNSTMLHYLLKCTTINPNIKTRQGYSPLHTAFITRNKDALRYLLQDTRVNVNLPTVQNDKVSTPLMLAIKHFDDTEMLELLLKAGADCNKDHNVLYHAIWQNNYEHVKALIIAGADLQVTKDFDAGHESLSLTPYEFTCRLIIKSPQNDVLTKIRQLLAHPREVIQQDIRERLGGDSIFKGLMYSQMSIKPLGDK